MTSSIASDEELKGFQRTELIKQMALNRVHAENKVMIGKQNYAFYEHTFRNATMNMQVCDQPNTDQYIVSNFGAFAKATLVYHKTHIVEFTNWCDYQSTLTGENVLNGVKMGPRKEKMDYIVSRIKMTEYFEYYKRRQHTSKKSSGKGGEIAKVDCTAARLGQSRDSLFRFKTLQRICAVDAEKEWIQE